MNSEAGRLLLEISGTGIQTRPGGVHISPHPGVGTVVRAPGRGAAALETSIAEGGEGFEAPPELARKESGREGPALHFAHCADQHVHPCPDRRTPTPASGHKRTRNVDRSAVLHCTVLCCTMLCCVVQCYTTLYCTVEQQQKTLTPVWKGTKQQQGVD